MGWNFFIDCWDSWTTNYSVSNRLAAITCWNIWNTRNKAIFEDKIPSAWDVVFRTLGSFTSAPCSQTFQITRQRPIILKNGFTCAQFDGASSAGGLNCGVGGFIIGQDSSRYRWYINCGEGTNTKAELLGAWTTLTLANHLNIQNIQVMGDSKVVIDWLNHKGNLQSTAIEGWKQRTMELATTFQGIYFQHIFREFQYGS
jgi:ribonuclease HI